MKNKMFWEELLNDENDYWVVAKENYSRQFMEEKRDKDDIILMAIPRKIKRPAELLKMTLGEIESWEDLEVLSNIYLSNNYGPFQFGLYMRNIYKGFPLSKRINAKEFLKKALEIQSNELDDYKKILEDIESNLPAEH